MGRAIGELKKFTSKKAKNGEGSGKRGGHNIEVVVSSF